MRLRGACSEVEAIGEQDLLNDGKLARAQAWMAALIENLGAA